MVKIGGKEKKERCFSFAEYENRKRGNERGNFPLYRDQRLNNRVSFTIDMGYGIRKRGGGG